MSPADDADGLPLKPSSDKTGAAEDKRVTMRDIAAKLGVSHVTVSYALRGIPRVSPELRDRIQAIALQMGYRPDPMLQALSTYRRASKSAGIRAALAWLCCWDPPEEMHTRKEFHAYWLGVKEVAEKHGYRLEQFVPSPKLSVARIQQIMLARGIHGVVVPPPQSTSPHRLDDSDWSKFAVVKFGHSHAAWRVSLVSSAHTFNAALAMAKMAERGYRRVGFVTSDYAKRHTQFLPGVLRAQVDLPPKDRVPHFCLPEAEIVTSDPTSLGAWIKKEKPDAILTNMREVPAMLRKLRVAVPADMGVAALSVHDGNADAGIDQNPLEIGRAACETVVSLILHGSQGMPTHPRELLIEGTWVEGSTLPWRTPAPKR